MSLYTEHQISPSEFLDYEEALGTAKAGIGQLDSYIYGALKDQYPDVEAVMGLPNPPTPLGQTEPFFGLRNDYLGITMFKNKSPREKEAGTYYLETLCKESDDILAEMATFLGALAGKVGSRSAGSARNRVPQGWSGGPSAAEEPRAVGLDRDQSHIQ